MDYDYDSDPIVLAVNRACELDWPQWEINRIYELAVYFFEKRPV